MKIWCLLFILVGCSIGKLQNGPTTDENNKLKNSANDSKVKLGPTLANTSFVDETELYGLGHLIATNFFVIDINLDGYSDLVYLSEYYSEPKFLVFSPKEKKFTDLGYNPFFDSIKAHYLLFYDFNDDNILDVIVGVLNQKTEIKKAPLRLYKGVLKNDKLFFELSENAITLASGPHATALPIDFDLDGDLDLFVGNWFDQTKNPPMVTPDYLLVNNKGVFTNASELLTDEWKTGPEGLNLINAKPTYAASICDMNQDGHPDILTSSTNGHSNKLWINSTQVRSDGRYFIDNSIQSGFAADTEGLLTAKGGGRTFSVVCADYNNDSIMDVFMGEIYHNYDADSADKSSILSGSTTKFNPKFIRTEYTLDSYDLSWHQADHRGLWFDYNLDGLQDLLIDNSGYPPHTRLVLFEQLSDHSFINRSEDLGVNFVNPLNTTLIDVNNDGRWDILSAQSDLRDSSIKRRIYLLVNKHEPVGRSLKLHLGGQKANQKGIGATVILKLERDEKLYERIFNVEYSQGGLPPQNEDSLIVAIAPGEKLRHILVRWPYASNSKSAKYQMEKKYEIKGKIGPEYTLCEAGYSLPGRGRCGR